MLDIVILDDEEWIRKLIRKLLPYDSFPIRVSGEAENGIEGLELIKKNRPQIILTDIRMPMLSGLELIIEIKKIIPNSEIIIISGYDDFDYARKAIKFGVLDYILKPVEQPELERAVNNAITIIDKKKKIMNEKSLLERKVKRLTAEYFELNHEEFAHINNEKIRKSLKYIHENYNKPISLNDLCDVVLMNISYFSELFKNEVGIGFNQYIISLRFNKAKKLLIEQKDLTIGDIAQIVGFQDANYFSRLFRKKYNCTAQEYRTKPLPKLQWNLYEE